MNKKFPSSYLDQYLSEHHYTDYSSIIFAKENNIIFEKHREGYTSDTKQDVSFLVPSLISLLTGIAIDRHHLKSVEVPIYTILPEFDLGRDHLHRVIKIKHLLSMTSGLLWSSSMHWLRPIYYDLLNNVNTSDVLSDILVSNVPGMKYCYKEWDYILLAIILEKVLDVSLDDFCKEALFMPLDIHLTQDDFCISVESIIYNLYGKEKNFTCSPNDINKLSQMIINNGIHENKKVISIGYIREMFEPQKANHNYGYLWSLYPFGYGINGSCSQRLIINLDLKISYLLLLKEKHKKLEYNGIYAKLMEHLLV